jgi:hypothetical protein
MPAAPEPRGIFCPVCTSRTIRCVNRAYPMARLKVRYYRCVNCKTRFRGNERLGAIIKKGTVPPL